MIGQERPALWPDVCLALLLFAWPPMTIWLWAVARELRRLREERRGFKDEWAATRSEGFPPPDPPATDHPTP